MLITTPKQKQLKWKIKEKKKKKEKNKKDKRNKRNNGPSENLKG